MTRVRGFCVLGLTVVASALALAAAAKREYSRRFKSNFREFQLGSLVAYRFDLGTNRWPVFTKYCRRSVLAVINPVVCGSMLSDADAEFCPRRKDDGQQSKLRSAFSLFW